MNMFCSVFEFIFGTNFPNLETKLIFVNVLFVINAFEMLFIAWLECSVS